MKVLLKHSNYLRLIKNFIYLCLKSEMAFLSFQAGVDFHRYYAVTEIFAVVFFNLAFVDDSDNTPIMPRAVRMAYGSLSLPGMISFGLIAHVQLVQMRRPTSISFL